MTPCASNHFGDIANPSRREHFHGPRLLRPNPTAFLIGMPMASKRLIRGRGLRHITQKHSRTRRAEIRVWIKFALNGKDHEYQGTMKAIRDMGLPYPLFIGYFWAT